MDDNEDLAGLLTEAQAGDKPALGTLLTRLRCGVRQRAQGLLGRQLDARLDGSDIVQEVYLRAWRRFDQFQGQTVPQLLAWVESILQNVITDCRRRHGHESRLVPHLIRRAVGSGISTAQDRVFPQASGGR